MASVVQVVVAVDLVVTEIVRVAIVVVMLASQARKAVLQANMLLHSVVDSVAAVVLLHLRRVEESVHRLLRIHPGERKSNKHLLASGLKVAAATMLHLRRAPGSHMSCNKLTYE